MSMVHVAIARRSKPEGLRAFAENETSALFTSELGRRQEEWRSALASVKHTLAELESTCDTVMRAAPEAPTGAVAGLIEKIVAAAAAEAEAAAQESEAQARAESAKAQAIVDRLQAEIRAGQEQLRIAREQLGEEHGARALAESASKEAQAAGAQAIAALEAQLRTREVEFQANRTEIAALRQQLEAGEVERAKLVATLEAVQRAVHRAVSAFEPAPPSSLPTAPSPPRPSPQRKGEGEATLVLVPPAALPPAARVKAPPPDAGPRPDACLSSVAPPAAPVRSIGDYATTLLETAEAMYWEEVNLALPPTEIVDRLTANLRHASDLFAARLGPDSTGESSAFMDQLTRLLDTKAATSFGRHLSIAAYEVERHERRNGRAAPQVLRQAGG